MAESFLGRVALPRVPCAKCRALQQTPAAHSTSRLKRVSHRHHYQQTIAQAQQGATSAEAGPTSELEERDDEDERQRWQGKRRSGPAKQAIPPEVLQEMEENEQIEREEQEASRRMADELKRQEELKSARQTNLEMVNEGYHAIKLEGCEFLIASDNDGRLNLQDIYVQDEDSGIFARPTATGDVPETPQFYSEIEWREEFLGDVVFNKPPRILVKKVYLIQITSLVPRRLDLETVWMLDAESRSVQKAVVERLTDLDDPTELMLRIRRDGSLLVDEAAIMPSADELIWEAESGIDTQRRPEIEDPDESVSDPIEAIEDDFDEPDVPAVDLA